MFPRWIRKEKEVEEGGVDEVEGDGGNADEMYRLESKILRKAVRVMQSGWMMFLWMRWRQLDCGVEGTGEG